MLSLKNFITASFLFALNAIIPAVADGLYLTNNIPQVSRWHHEMGIACNNKYGGGLFMVVEGETQFNDWQLMAIQMDWNRRDYACEIKARPSDTPGDPFITVGLFEIVMNQDFSGALLKNISAAPGYQYKLVTGQIDTITPDINISISKAN